ncbi:hypothetical protein IT400_04275 [Candidatus Nomurabacteria bacterium]|nr:hypothetical protein [Candidatus Nomurabacteria bacterium]
MDYKFYIGILAGLIAFFAYIVYIRSILKGETKPNKTTWWIWTFMGAVVGVSYYFSGAEATMWVAVSEFIGPLVIALLSLKYGTGGVKDRTDLICLIGALISIVLWIIFDSPVIALITNLIVDVFAVIPTIKHIRLNPDDEGIEGWFITWVADCVNLFAIDRLILGVIVYPVYMFIIDSIMVLVIRKSQKKVK